MLEQVGKVRLLAPHAPKPVLEGLTDVGQLRVAVGEERQLMLHVGGVVVLRSGRKQDHLAVRGATRWPQPIANQLMALS